jgi:hypothetical protein
MNAISVPDVMLEPLAKCFTPEVAKSIVESCLDPIVQARIDELAAKANRGTLSDAEREQYSEFVEYIDFVAIVKAKARRLLQQAG